jgi:hypothetical protein
MEDIGPIVVDARKAVQGINSTVTQLNTEITPSAGRALEQISTSAVDIRSMILDIQSLLGEIERNPSQFVYRQPQPVEK